MTSYAAGRHRAVFQRSKTKHPLRVAVHDFSITWSL